MSAEPGPLRIKLQLVCDAERALGPGRADVLDAIDRLGSISAAGRALAMSYRRAWLLVDSMNRCFTERLVETASGGAGHGGARLTATGQSVLGAYRALQTQVAAAADGPPLATLTALLRSAPAEEC